MDNEEYTVLIVDDEEMVTTSISALFMLETSYEVLVFNSPGEALEELKDKEIDLVIADFLMPGEMNGVEFLLELKKLQPEAIRVLLTAYADKENAIRAINEVGLYQYVEKPWDNDALLLLVRNGLSHGKLLKQLVARTQELATRKQELEARTQELDITRGNLERVQTEILKAFV